MHLKYWWEEITLSNKMNNVTLNECTNIININLRTEAVIYWMHKCKNIKHINIPQVFLDRFFYEL